MVLWLIVAWLVVADVVVGVVGVKKQSGTMMIASGAWALCRLRPEGGRSFKLQV
jgi:hypothetical protein